MDANTSAPPLDAKRMGTFEFSRTIADLPAPKGLPLVGSLLKLSGRQFHLTLADWIREFGPVFRLDVMGHQLMVLSEPAAVEGLLRDRPDGFRRTSNLKTSMGELKIAGVITAEGDDWRKQRRLVMGGLNAEVVRNFFPTMVAITERVLLRWKTAVAEGRRIDLHRDLKAMALDVIVAIAMGQDIDAVNDEGNQVQRDIDNIFQRLGARNATLLPYWRHFKLPVDRAADKSAADIEQAVIGFVQDARERMAQQPQLRQKPGNMLEAMIAASENPESGFTDQELISNAIMSVIGGEDTTANSMAWMINLLAQNPEAAATLAAEVDTVLGDAPVAREWEWLKQLPYLEAAHSETQRLRAVAPFMGFASNADCVVADTFVPKDTVIFVANTGASQDEVHFPQHELFRPERWIFDGKPSREEDPSRKVFPFGAGPRLCPGRFLALTEIKMVLAMLVHNFELVPDRDAPPVEQLLNFFVGPSAVPVRLKLRAR